MLSESVRLPKCEAGRKEMSRDEKVRHFAKCTHPQCLTLLALYQRIAARCRQELFKLVPKEFECTK